MEGKPIKNKLVEFKCLSSLGKSSVKQRNAAGMTPEAAKLILPHNSFMEGSLEK